MKRIVFIVPYYGKFPNFFKEWVYSVGFLDKQNIDFLLITDIKIDFDLPKNIHIKNISFDCLKARFEEHLKFSVALETPYKLCDLRPVYGEVFREEISQYDFWGHCDIDLVWGDFRKFITDEILEKYDRIQYLGHCLLYRNTDAMNGAYQLDGDYYDYKTVFSSPRYYSFDEHPGMMNIVIKNKISNFVAINLADISPVYDRIRISRVRNYEHQIVYWKDGKVYCSYLDDAGEIQTDEYMYFHFQQKHPRSLDCWMRGEKPTAFLLHKDKFVDISGRDINKELVLEYSDFVSTVKDKKDQICYILNKLKKFLLCSFEEKVVWLHLRKATKKAVSNKAYFQNGDY